MTTQKIVESGMTFGPYRNGMCFYVEKSNTYAKIKQDVKMAEFLLLVINDEKQPVLLVVEAKSSTPKPKNQPNFDEFVENIREKWINAFSLSWASCLKRHQEAHTELPDLFKNLDLSQAEVRFVLVINGHQVSWLPPIQDALKKALHSTIKTWGFKVTSVAVINEEGAKKYGIINSE